MRQNSISLAKSILREKIGADILQIIVPEKSKRDGTDIKVKFDADSLKLVTVFFPSVTRKNPLLEDQIIDLQKHDYSVKSIYPKSRGLEMTLFVRGQF